MALHRLYNIDSNKRLFLRDKIIEGSRKYKNKLMNKNIFVICEDGTSHSICFFANDFLHLAGVDTNLSEARFFEDSYRGFLAEGNINQQQKYNWDTLKGKAKRIEKIDKIIYTDVQDSLFMENLHTNTYTYRVAIRNTTQNACVGFKDSVNKARSLNPPSGPAAFGSAPRPPGISPPAPGAEQHRPLPNCLPYAHRDKEE